MERPFEVLGARIRGVRQRAGYTVPEVCRILGISEGYLYKVERGDLRPSQLLSFALSNLYQVMVTEIDSNVDFTEPPGFEGRTLK